MEEERLSPIKRAALVLLDELKEQIMTDCDDDEVVESLAKFNPERHGYVKEDDFVNYDEALKILKLSNNRSKLNALCKEYNIKNVRFNNAAIGFKKKEIERLAELQKEEVKAREKKILKKQGYRKFLW